MASSAPSVSSGSVQALVEHRLGNGLRLVLQPDKSVPIVGLALYYDVGSRNEEPGRTGFAHLFEHMMFQGSANVPKNGHFQHILGWGGQVNGTTSQDRTNYYCSLPSHQLGLGLWLEADRMRTLAVTPENVENQRQTVMEERRQRVDDAPYGQASVRIGELSYRCFAYAHPVIGYWDDLHAATLDDVVAFHARWYRPDNAVLALTGDLDPDEAIAQVEALFGDIAPGGPRPSPDLGEPLRTSAVKERITDPLARLPAVMVNHLAPDFDHPDFYTYELIETLLFQGTSSRVHRRIVLEEAAAVQVSGGYDCHRGPSSFGLFAAVAAGGDLDRVVALYQEELDRIATEPVPDREIEKALNQLRSGRVFGLENVLGRALQLGRSVLYHQDAAWEERYLDRVAAVTRADILRVAARDFSAPRVELQVVPA